MTVNVLGTEYSIEYKTDTEVAEDMALNVGECDGYCNSAKRLIVIAKEDSFDVGGMTRDINIKTHIREAIITAFANETKMTGLSEETAEWFAKQFPEMVKTLKEVGAIDGCKCNNCAKGSDEDG